MTGWREYFDAAYAAGDHDYPAARMRQETMAVVLKVTGDLQGRTVLDAGCGQGVQAAAADALGAVVVAFDFAADQVKRNAERWPSVTWFEGDLTQPDTWPDPDVGAVYDVVWAVECLEYVNAAVVVPQLWQRVDIGGRLVVSIANAANRLCQIAPHERPEGQFVGVSAVWLDRVCGRQLPGCVGWSMRALHLGTDQRVEVFDAALALELYEPAPYHVVACFLRG